MVKFDQDIINIFNEYIPYLYKNTLDIADLELDINYRNKSQNYYSQLNELRSKYLNYSSKNICNLELKKQIKDLEYQAKLYNTWGALQEFYLKNKNTFFSNINQIDLHGLYQKEAAAMLYIVIPILINNKIKTLKIITGNGKFIIHKITLSVLNHFKIKYKVQSNNIIASL